MGNYFNSDYLNLTTITVILLSLLGLISVIYLFRKRKWIFIVIKTFPRDCRGLFRFIITFRSLKQMENKNLTVGKVFDATARANSSKVCFYFEDQQWTFQDVMDLSNQIGNYFLAQGFKKGDNIALFMENCPEFICIWLGLSKIGVVVPLINSNLRSSPLVHSVSLAKAKAIIFGIDLVAEIENAHELDVLKMAKYSWGDLAKPSSNIKNLKQIISDYSTDCPIPIEPVNFTDNILYIYTSGTTGLPKPAIVKHSRFFMGSISFHHMNCLSFSDTIYTCLPLYHTAAGICAVGQAIFYGNSVVIRKRFSAKMFWNDCIKHNVTIAQYIGELCRYLLAQPQSLEETGHKIRRMIGNGLRPEIWKSFVDRFHIPNISEIYGSTDGNCNFVNFDNKVGAVGFIPILLQKLYPMKIIRIDEETGIPMRDVKTGMTIDCKTNEPGELCGKIIHNHIIRDFSGYANMTDGSTEKKMLNNVFAKGDVAFRTGDYLVMDELGYFYFKDRTGDTFRWKGENCSTAEIESAIVNISDLHDVVVYGVSIPGTDGKAGMATIADPDGKVDLEYLSVEVTKSLPSFAIPIFIRISKSIEITGTFKLKKTELQKEGFNINIIQEPIYIFLKKTYVRLDPKIMDDLNTNSLRL